MAGQFTIARERLHGRAFARLIRLNDNGVPNFADSDSNASSRIAKEMVRRLGGKARSGKLPGQTAGKIFEELTLQFLEECFLKLGHLRPGKWRFQRKQIITSFEQFSHLTILEMASKSNSELKAALGEGHVIKPDVVILREPEEDEVINREAELVDDRSVNLASLREKNGGKLLLHASVSCKYSIRSDRAQNSRSEALNLIRNRKGRTPHIVVVTAEPMPSRIGSIALGTGDLDCVYHLALDELHAAVKELGDEVAQDLLAIMIQGKRLRDITDLPLDLAV